MKQFKSLYEDAAGVKIKRTDDLNDLMKLLGGDPYYLKVDETVSNDTLIRMSRPFVSGRPHHPPPKDSWIGVEIKANGIDMFTPMIEVLNVNDYPPQHTIHNIPLTSSVVKYWVNNIKPEHDKDTPRMKFIRMHHTSSWEPNKMNNSLIKDTIFSFIVGYSNQFKQYNIFMDLPGDDMDKTLAFLAHWGTKRTPILHMLNRFNKLDKIDVQPDELVDLI